MTLPVGSTPVVTFPKDIIPVLSEIKRTNTIQTVVCAGIFTASAVRYVQLRERRRARLTHLPAAEPVVAPHAIHKIEIGNNLKSLCLIALAAGGAAFIIRMLK